MLLPLSNTPPFSKGDSGGFAGSRPVGEWLGLLEDRRSALYRKLEEIYGGDGPLAEKAAGVCLRTIRAFRESFGPGRSLIIVRSTGRINLMGMHIDHRGGAVNPIAIKEVFLAAEPRNDDTVLLRNVQSDEFPEEKFRIRDCLPLQGIEDWDTWCHDEYEKRRRDPTVTWSNYVRAAFLYLQHLNTTENGTFDPALRGMNAMVYGTVPRAAGLSASSSIVVAVAEACIRVNSLEIDHMEFADICGYGEWYVGTRGGSGDHAAIKRGQPNAILHITSFPLTVKPLPFPRGYRIVLANSLVEARKQTGARDAFNSRVASYEFGLMLARKNFPQYASRIERLRDINPEILDVDECEIYRIVKTLPESATRRNILELLPGREAELRNVFRSHAEPPTGYRVRQVCMYGITECIRAGMAAERLTAGDVQGFGELMTISHDGDRVTRLVGPERVPTDNSCPDDKIDALIDDLDSGDPSRVEGARLWRQSGGYDASLAELDTLVDIALACPGVAGAGLVGAGLGGSIVAVVEEAHARELLEGLANDYYRPRDLPPNAEIVRPVGGAGVLDV